jgi:circadian clock protein KaiC
MPSVSRSKSGIPGLDEILSGGFLAHRLYLVDGNPGAGKTTFALQYLLEGVRSGEICLYITLSETRQELEAGARSHGWSLDGIEIVELISKEYGLENDEQLTMLPPSEVELSETTRRLLDAIERISPSRLIFDSLSELRLLAQSSLRYRRQILALKQFFIGRQCTVVMLDDRTAEGPDLQLHSIAHGVIALDANVPPYGQTQRELQVLKFRGSDFTSGFHDYALQHGGLRVFPRLVAAQHRVQFERERLSSGVPALDALWGGGVERGTSTLVVGAAGCGKSTLCLQYAAAAAAQGHHAAVFLFDETPAAVLARCAGLGIRFREGTGAGELALHPIDPVAISPGEFAHRVRTEVETHGARVIVVDSLNGYLNAVPGNAYLTAQLHEVLAYLNNQGVASFLVLAQSGMVDGPLVSPVDASYLVDSVLLLRYFEHAGAIHKAVSVLKQRTGPHERHIRELWFDAAGIHLDQPLFNLRGVLGGMPIEVSDRSPRLDLPGNAA